MDLASGSLTRSITGFNEPQGVAYIPETHSLFVSNGRNGTVDVIDTGTFWCSEDYLLLERRRQHEIRPGLQCSFRQTVRTRSYESGWTIQPSRSKSHNKPDTPQGISCRRWQLRILPVESAATSTKGREIGKLTAASLVVILAVVAVGILYLQSLNTGGQPRTSQTVPTSSTSVSSSSSQTGLAVVTVLSGSLKAADFKGAGTTTTFSCGTSAVGSYIRLSNSGSGTGSVIAVTLTWNGATDVFTPLGECLVGPAGYSSTTEYVLFSTTSRFTFSASVGGAVTGFVILSGGAEIAFAGSFE